MSLQIWVEEFGVFVRMSELRGLERCSVQVASTVLSCNFCGHTFIAQEDLRRHLYMAHSVAQCRSKGCHCLFNDVFSRDFHEKILHCQWCV